MENRRNRGVEGWQMEVGGVADWTSDRRQFFQPQTIHPSNLPCPAVTVAVPGTCGELVQGWHPDWDEAVLVSCPIGLYSQVAVQIRPWPGLLVPGPPGGAIKLRRAARLAFDFFNRPDLGAEIRVNSQLLPGRGMASSTADIVAVMAALALALDQPLAAEDIARLACQIEPSDSTMFAGLASLAYRSSGRYEELGLPPQLPLLMLDTGQSVDTLTYNARLDLAAVRQLAPTTRVALEWLREGIRANNPAAIGAAATLSAISYQAISYNPLLLQAQQWATETGALGIIRAHSGSVIGLLYHSSLELNETARWLARRFNGDITQTYLAGGGYQLAAKTGP